MLNVRLVVTRRFIIYWWPLRHVGILDAIIIAAKSFYRQQIQPSFSVIYTSCSMWGLPWSIVPSSMLGAKPHILFNTNVQDPDEDFSTEGLGELGFDLILLARQRV